MRRNAFLDLLFPPVCPLCEKAAAEREFCPVCEDAFNATRINTPSCGVCGAPFISTGAGPHTCGKCIKEPPPFIQSISACIYEGITHDALIAFKFHAKTHLAAGLGALLAAAARFNVKPQVAIPVPLHASRLRHRGYNQSLLLARQTGRALSIPIDYTSLGRVRHDPPQSGLKASDRRLNIKGAFVIKEPRAVNGRRVLLVDDVLTTGSTVTECASVLKAAGASVYVLTLARARDL